MSSSYASALADAGEQKICETVEDFYTKDARRTIYRLLGEFCVQNKVSVIEILHSADLINKLENNASAAMLHAIQLRAASYSSSAKIPVKDALNHVNRLVSEASNRVIADSKSRRFPQITADKFGALADSLSGKPDGLYILNGALAAYLRNAGSWNEKIARLVKVVHIDGPDGPGKQMLIDAIDEILAEMLACPAALIDLIGLRDNFGECVISVTQLFLGQQQKSQYTDDICLADLTRLFAAGRMAATRTVLGMRIIADIQSLKRLREDTIESEMRLFRQMADLVCQGIGPHLKREELMPALELRAARFVAPDTMRKSLGSTTLPDEKVNWLFLAAECVVGARSRYQIADQIFRIITATTFRNRVLSTQIPAPKRLGILYGLNASALRSRFDEDQRKRMARTFDDFAVEVAKQAKLFETIEAQPVSPDVKVQTVLKLFASGQITTGKLSDMAHKILLGYLSQAGFLTGYLQNWAQTHDGKLDKQMAILELARSLHKVGLAPDTFLSAMAA